MGEIDKEEDGFSAALGEPHLSWAGLAWRIYGKVLVKKPTFFVYALLMLVILVLHSSAKTSRQQDRFMYPYASVLVAVFIFHYGVMRLSYWRRPKSEACGPILERQFQVTQVLPERWLPIMRMDYRRKFRQHGYVRRGVDPRQSKREVYKDLTDFLLDVGKDITSRGDLQGATMSVSTHRVKTAEVLQHALFIFEPEPAGNGLQLTIQIGFSMPLDQRQQLFQQITGQIVKLPGVTALTS